jgi:hypothetical protein
MTHPLVLLVVYALAWAGRPATTSAEEDLTGDRPAGAIETFAAFDGPMPSGVMVSHSVRILVCFPKWGDRVDFTVAEVKGGKPVAYRDEATNRAEGPRDGEHLISMQSVVVDPSDRLWAVDTGSIAFGPTSRGGPKLVGVDLETNKVVRTINLPPDVVLPTTRYHEGKDLRQRPYVLFRVRIDAGSVRLIK